MLRARVVAACRSSLTLVERWPKAIRSPASAGRDHDQLALQVGLAHDHLVAVGEHVRGGAELASARDDRELARRGRVAERLGHDGVRGLVDRDQPALLLGQDVAFLAGPGDDAVDRLLERRLVDLPAPVAHAQQRRLVDHVGELGAAEAGRLARDLLERGVGRRAGACRRAGAGSPGARARRGCRSTTWRSKRPGRSSAGSRMSGRLVAPITTRPPSPEKPSISTRIWLSVCSRSSLPWPMPAPRLRPAASSSSMKMIAGAALRALRNRSRTRAAPTPTSDSTKSEPDSEKKEASASPATALASSVLPVPGGPDQQHALRRRRADRQVLARDRRGSRGSRAARPPPRRRRRRRRR